MSYPARMMHQPSHRLTELLEAIKQEFDSIANEASMYRVHKDEYDQKVLSQQTVELQQIRQAVYELDMSHRKMKDSYEEEILRLKRELEAAGAGNRQYANAPATHSNNTAPPTLTHSSTVFGSGQKVLGPAPGAPPEVNTGAAAQQPSVAAQSHQQTQQQKQTYAAGYGYNQSAGLPGATAQTSRGTSPTAPKKANDSESNAQPPAPTSNVNNTLPHPTGASIQPTPDGQEPSPEQLGNVLGDVPLDKVPPELKKQRDDWFVLYNEKAPKQIDVDMVHNLEHNSVVCCVRFSLDGRYIATGCNRTAQIFDVETGQLVCRLQDEGVDRDGDLYIRSVCFSPDGRYLAAGAEDKQIRIWDIQTRTIRYLFTGHEQDIYSLDFSRNGRHIASGSGDRTVRMWDMESGQCILTLSIEDGVTTVAISPDGRYVAAGSLDRTVRVWDTSTGFLVERLEAPDGHKDSVYSVAFTPSGKDLISGSLDKTIKLWELQAPRGIQSTHKGGVCVRTFRGHKDFVLSVASTPDGQWIISGSKDRGVQFWDPRTTQVQLMLQGHKNSVISVAPSPAGGLFATGSGDCRARIWRYYPRA